MPALPPSRELFADATSPAELSERKDALVKAATEATVGGLAGETYFSGSTHESGTPLFVKRADKRREVLAGLSELGLAKSASPQVLDTLRGQLTGAKSELLSKEWSLTNPISSGLVPFDLEAPAKLLVPRQTPIRNMVPRVKGQGGSRRFKVITGISGSGTGGTTTVNPGITEQTTNVGPGGLAYIRPPYINYAGYDTTVNYVSWGLSDSVSWQAEFEGQGFEDIRTLSNTALLYATMLMDERLAIYGRGTTANGYVGALSSITITAASVTAASAPSGSSTLTGTTYWVIAAADAGDLFSGTAFHQGPTTAAASVTVAAGQAISVTIGTDAVGALGYNLFVGSVSTGPFCFAGRTGYNVGYITAPPALTNGTALASAGDASAIATNFDGFFPNLAASGGYVKRLNSTLSTSNPGTELQAMFSGLWDTVKADPDEVWLNGHDRNRLSNCLLASGTSNNYSVFLAAPDQAGARIGALVQGIYNQVTGKELSFSVLPWSPQGNIMVRSSTLPIPDSNVSSTSYMAMVQDYVAINWVPVQFSYDSSVLEIGSMIHAAPAWSGVLQGVVQSG